MITIAPSILSADFANLGRDVQRVREADWLHVDVMDGMFVSNISIGVPVVKSLRKFTDQFLVMTVEPGFGGQAFMADQLPKIAAIRRYIQERNPACRLEVDGGVDPVTARQVVEAGADVLVAGSAIYGAPDPAQAIRALRGE